MSPPELNPSELIGQLEMLNLEHLRMRAGLSATDVARILGVDVSTVRRLETGATSATKQQILDYLEAIGYRKPTEGLFAQGEQVDDPYFLARAVRDALLAPLITLNRRDSSSYLLPELTLGVEALKRTLPRPKVALLGQTNSGKSTFGNTLLGADVFPAAQKKLTRVPVLLRHMDHLPRNKSHTCFVFRAGTKFSDLDDDENLPEPAASGESDLLAQLGIYVNENAIADFVKKLPGGLFDRFFSGSEQAEGIGIIMMYLRNPVLRIFDLIDTPGVSNLSGDRDTAIALATQQECDLSIICSRQDGFLDGPELVLAANAVKQGPWMGAMRYIGVATKGDPSRVQHRSRIMEGLKAVVKSVDAEVSLLDELMARTLNFVDKSRGGSDAMFKFLLEEFNEVLPSYIKGNFYRTVTGWKLGLNERLDAQIETLRLTLDGKLETAKILDVFENATMPEAIERATESSAKIGRQCRHARRVMLDAADKICTLVETEQWVAKTISMWYAADEKDMAKATIVSRLGTMIDKELAVVGEREAVVIAQEAIAFDRSGDSMTEAISRAGADTSKISSVSMEQAVAPTIGIVGLVTLSGTALTGTLAAVGSATGLGVLFSGVLGLGAAAGGAVGGAIGLGTFGAALGAALSGAVLVVGLVAAVAFAWDLLSSSWQERLARNVVKHFKASSLRKNLADGIEAFWSREETIWRDSFENYKDRLRRQLSTLREHADGKNSLNMQLNEAVDIKTRLNEAFADHWDTTTLAQEEPKNG